MGIVNAGESLILFLLVLLIVWIIVKVVASKLPVIATYQWIFDLIIGVVALFAIIKFLLAIAG